MADDVTTDALVEAGAGALARSYTRDDRRAATMVDADAMRAALRAMLGRAGVTADTLAAASGVLSVHPWSSGTKQVAALLRALAGVQTDG